MNNLFGITLGDASGIGPEVLLKSYREGRLSVPIVVYGDLSVLAYYNDLLHLDVPLQAISDVTQRVPDALNVINHGLIQPSEIQPGTLSAAAGAAARVYVVSAAKAALAGEIAAMVTLPMNKEATQLTDPHFVGHTELIGAVCGVDDVTIMLVSDELIVTHVSTHCSLAEAIARTKQPRIKTILGLTSDAVKKLLPNPRIAVAGLNPHAGEHGLFGREEIDEIRPAVEWAQAQGMPVDGPFPPDTLFYLAVRRKRYDAIVCMYHDQGHIPVKALAFDKAVNTTLGLPIIRTSVDHGTALNIAWQGRANPGSLFHAVRLAVRLATAA